MFALAACTPAEAPDVTSCVERRAIDVVAIVEGALQEMPGRDSEGLRHPSHAELEAFDRSVAAALGGDHEAACAAAAQAGYRYAMDEDTRAWLASAPHGRGLYVLGEDSSRSLSIAAPHPLYDRHTGSIAARAFVDLDARALLIAGAHRCANAAPSDSAGRTRACSRELAPYRISDMAHTQRSTFQHFHVAMADVGVETHLQIHGMAGALPFSISDGTTGDASDAHPSNALARALGDGNSCNRAGDTDTLCGIHNVQGRYVRRAGRGKFVHVELSLALRKAPQRFIEALR